MPAPLREGPKATHRRQHRVRLAVFNLHSEAQVDALDRAGTFTAVVETGGGLTRRWTTRQAAILLEMRPDGHVLELGTVHAESHRVATGLRRIRYQRLYESSAPPSLEALENALEPRFRSFLWERSFDGGLLPPVTARRVVEALIKIDREFGEATASLLEEERETHVDLDTDALQAAAQEADTVRLAADIARIPRPQLQAAPPDGERSFLERVGAYRVPESTAIAFDAMHFLDFDRIDQPNGAITFSQGREQLVVINVNTQSLETTTGADLIYVNERRDSVVLVQYKTMKQAPGDEEAVYRPDRRLAGQLERMASIPTVDSDGTPEQYRLHPGCAYVKLCSPVRSLTTEPTQLVSGMYIPIDYWDTLAASPTLKGPRGGTIFSYRTVDRHVSNELFVALVRGA